MCNEARYDEGVRSGGVGFLGGDDVAKGFCNKLGADDHEMHQVGMVFG
jgi:hypothetical protein